MVKQNRQHGPKGDSETQIRVRSFDSTLSPEEFLALPRMPVSVILEDLRSAFNVGSIIRTADCARIEKIVFCGYTAHPPHKKLDKTSLGALPYAAWERRPDALEAVASMKEAGIPVAALELTDRSRWIWDFSFPLPVALVLGNEALGVSQEVLRQSDFIIEIPMLGYKNSINVAVAFGICVYEIQRQYWKDIRRANEIPLESLKSKKETG